MLVVLLNNLTDCERLFHAVLTLREKKVCLISVKSGNFERVRQAKPLAHFAQLNLGRMSLLKSILSTLWFGLLEMKSY